MNHLPFEALGAVLPVFLLAAVEHFAVIKMAVDISTRSKVCIYILIPALTFKSLTICKADLGSVWLLTLGTFSDAISLAPLFLWSFGVVEQAAICNCANISCCVRQTPVLRWAILESSCSRSSHVATCES